MDASKIGQFLKHQRNLKGITQAQLAEEVGVSNRSVSRWENGASLPDLSILVWLADYYQVDIADMIKGQTKEETDMQTQDNETIKEIVAYSEQEKALLKKFYFYLFMAGIFLLGLSMTLDRVVDIQTPVTEFLIGMGHGFSFGLLVLGALMTSGKLDQWVIRKRKWLNK